MIILLSEVPPSPCPKHHSNACEARAPDTRPEPAGLWGEGGINILLGSPQSERHTGVGAGSGSPELRDTQGPESLPSLGVGVSVCADLGPSEDPLAPASFPEFLGSTSVGAGPRQGLQKTLSWHCLSQTAASLLCPMLPPLEHLIPQAGRGRSHSWLLGPLLPSEVGGDRGRG